MIKTKSEQNLGFLTISTIGLGRPTLLALEVAWWRSLAERPPRGMDEAVGRGARSRTAGRAALLDIPTADMPPPHFPRRSLLALIVLADQPISRMKSIHAHAANLLLRNVHRRRVLLVGAFGLAGDRTQAWHERLDDV